MPTPTWLAMLSQIQSSGARGVVDGISVDYATAGVVLHAYSHLDGQPKAVFSDFTTGAAIAAAYRLLPKL